jgi:hypothetical protein
VLPGAPPERAKQTPGGAEPPGDRGDERQTRRGLAARLAMAGVVLTRTRDTHRLVPRPRRPSRNGEGGGPGPTTDRGELLRHRLRLDDHDAQHGGEHQRQDRNVVAHRATRICRIILDLTYRCALNAPLMPIEAWSVPLRSCAVALAGLLPSLQQGR